MRKSPRPELELEADGDLATVQIQELASSGFALAMQLMGNRDDAADAVQDSLHTVIRKRRMYDANRGSLRAWFLKIVRNRSLDMLRRRARREVTVEQLPEKVGAADQGPDRSAERRELLGLLRQQLMAMRQDHREIILLRDFHDLSYCEIAEVLAVPRGTVMSRLHRARLELRRRMESVVS